MKTQSEWSLGSVWKTVAAMLVCVVATCSFSSCSSDESSPYDPAYAKSRTVMLYMVAENSLYDVVPADVREAMNTAAVRQAFYPGDRLVIYVDDMGMPRIYVIDRGTTATSLSELDPVKTYGADVNSASAEQLGAFVAYVKENYPADSYGLVMWSHATGWTPSTYSGDDAGTAPRRSFGLDNGANTQKSGSIDVGHQMNVADMARVLEEQGGVEFVFFDACFMQCVEVAYELRNATRHVIGSPAEIPGPGANYKTMLPAMFRQDDYAEQMLAAYYDEYCNQSSWGIVVSDVNTSALPGFAAYTKQLVARYRSALLEADYSHVQDYFRYGDRNTGTYATWGKNYPDFYDMQGVMKQVLDSDDYAQWLNEAAKVVTCRQAGFWFSGDWGGKRTYQIDAEQCSGVSMFVPLEKYEGNVYHFRESYLATSWAQDVWAE